MSGLFRTGNSKSTLNYSGIFVPVVSVPSVVVSPPRINIISFMVSCVKTSGLQDFLFEEKENSVFMVMFFRLMTNESSL